MAFSTVVRRLLGLGLVAMLLLAFRGHAQTAPAWASVQRATSAGYGNSSSGRRIAVAPDGSQYVTGAFAGTIVLGPATLTAGAGLAHTFLAKYSAAGAVLWAIKIDATAGSQATSSAVATDAAGNAYLLGNFLLGATVGSTTLTSTAPDSYLVKYDAQGVQQWVRQGGDNSVGGSMATDAAGNVAVAGTFTTSVAFGGTPLTGGGLFYYKFSPTGSILLASRVGTGAAAAGLALDGAGNAYLAGGFYNTATLGATTLVSAGASDIFVCKLDATGTAVWARRDGGATLDGAYDVAVDAGGNPIVCGYSDQLIANNLLHGKVYVARFTTQGTPVWSQQLAITSTGAPLANGVAYDGRGGYFVTGSFLGTVMFGTTALTTLEQQTFVVRYDAQGNVAWANQTVGSTAGISSSRGVGIAADASGNVYLTGAALGTVLFGSQFISVGSWEDVFVAKLTAGSVLAGTHAATAGLALTAYPNPASGTATVVVPTGSGQLEVLDALGRRVLQQALPATAGPCAIPLAGLAPGLYQLRATLGNGQPARATLQVQ